MKTVSAVSALNVPKKAQQVAIRNESDPEVVILIIFASRGVNVECSSWCCQPRNNFVFAVLLIRRFFVSGYESRVSKRRNEMGTNFLLPSGCRFIESWLLAGVAAINPNITDL